MAFKRLSSDRGGATAMIYALTFIPVMAVVAGALDFSARESLERELKTATDAAAIAAVRFAVEGGLNGETDSAEIILAAQESFQSNIQGMGAGYEIVPVVELDEETGITITATFQYPTSMLGIIGIADLGVTARSRAMYQAGTAIEAVLVLDNSYSMNGSRMDGLRDATELFLDTVLVEGNDAVKVAVVPFNNYVNVGTEARHESWIDVPSDYSETSMHCTSDEAEYISQGCTQVPCTHSSDYTGCMTWSCPPSASFTPVCNDVTYNLTWFGCVESRQPPLDVEDDDFASKPERGRMATNGWGCPTAILPLTSDRSDLDSHIESLVPVADTYIAPGIAWGVRVLSSQEPFSEGADEAAFASEGGQKVLILMSDGENTRSMNSWGNQWGDNWGTDVDDANETTLSACEYAKSQDIQVYTVAFGVTDADTLEILEDCASDIEQFYSAENAAQLSGAFADIGRSFKDIALVE